MRNAIAGAIRRVLRIPSPSRVALGMEPDATWAREAQEREERRTGRGLRLTDDGWRWVDLPAAGGRTTGGRSCVN